MRNVIFKVAFIGAGSVEYAEKLLIDILSVPEFKNIDIWFHDIDQRRLDMSVALCQKQIDGNNLNIKIHSTLDRREAIAGARYVINMVKVGGMKGWEHDLMIPLSYGVDQCVGDTLCAGGIMYGMRQIPVVLGICEDMRKYAEPDALFLNVSNPLTMTTWAAAKYGKVRAIGMCHGVWLGSRQFESITNVPLDELFITCLGVNHMGFYTEVRTWDRDLIPELPEGYANHPKFREMEKARRDMMLNFGTYCTESNGHTTDLVPWYRNDLDKIKPWVSYYNVFCGETNGYFGLGHLEQETAVKNYQTMLDAPPRKFEYKNRSPEHASRVMEALETDRIYRGHLNIVNNGAIKNFMDEAIVEIPCYVDAHGVSVPMYGEMDAAQAGVISPIVTVNKLACDAGCTGDLEKLYQAMLLDPLTGARLGTREIRQMTDEMLLAEAEWLPQFADAIPEIRACWEKAEAEGTLFPRDKEYKGSTVRDFPYEPFRE